MNMEKQEIIKALAAGKYEIKHEENCNCSFDWDVEGDQLVDGVSSDECWEGNILYVDGEAIAQSIRFEHSEVSVEDLDRDDISDEIWDKMGMSEMVERGESANSEMHEQNRREALIDFLMESNYILDCDDERGFANEYTMILREPKGGGKNAPEVTREEAEKWADQYLYLGDAATEAYNGFRLEEEDAENE